MLKISKEKLDKIEQEFNGKKVAVIGDMMIDCYFWGDVKRISPEAPVPVVEVDDEFFRFGGAANVAKNILTLGGTPLPIGVIGNDEDGKKFKAILEESGISPEGIVIDETRPTTAKTRVIAAQQHIVRIDKEAKTPISENIENKILDYLYTHKSELNAVILEDYNKGVLTKRLIKEAISFCNDNGIIVNVDPKFDNFFEYQNVTVFKPNKKETADAFGIRLDSDEAISKAGARLLDKMNSRYVLLTLGSKGIALFENGKPERRISTKAREVADVSGAGDTVISTLTMALTAGADIYEAAYLANYAGGIVCGEVGIAPIERDKLFTTVKDAIK